MSLTLEEIGRRVSEIRLVAERGDDEKAHALEDQLRSDVLQSIAAGDPLPRSRANMALETSSIKFGRWMA